jgi:hypothetical protein
MRHLILLLVAFALTACGVEGISVPSAEVDRAAVSAPSSAAPPHGDEIALDPTSLDEVSELLDGVARAFLDGDADALRVRLHDPGSAFAQRWLERLENISDVPLATYRLVVEPTTGDLATDDVRQRFGDPTRVVHVREHHEIDGYDLDGPAVESLFLTVVRTEDGWRIASDSDVNHLGLTSAVHLWDIGPVSASEGGPFIVLHHPDVADRVPQLIQEAQAALDDMQRRWGLEWSGRVPIIVPRDQDELARLLNVTFELDNFIAFATATADRDLGVYELTGSRVVINPDRFLDRTSETRRLILAHELLHVASRPHAGPFTPAWVEEGVAQRLGEDRSTTGTRLVDAQVARGFTGDLPLDAEFTTGDRDRIWLSYQLSFSFADYLVGAYGEEALARFYASLGRGSVGEPGRRAYHLDRAAEEVYGRSLDELRTEWVRALRGG